MPPTSIENHLYVGDLPFKCNKTEARLVSPNLEFMKIQTLPAGGQKGIKGPVVNVKVDPQEICLKLPRDDAGIIPVQLKRDVSHRSVVVEDPVNPDTLMGTLKFFKEHNPYFKEIIFNEDWIKNNYGKHSNFFDVYIKDDPALEDYRKEMEEAQHLIGPTDLPYESVLMSENSDSSDLIFKYAPGQGKKPTPLFSDPNAEVYAFPTLFPLGTGHFNEFSRPVKLTRQKYLQNRLFNEDQRWADEPEYIFFMTHMIEKEAFKGQSSTHLRKGVKRNANGDIINARLLTDYTYGNANLLSHVDAFKFAAKCKGTPQYWSQQNAKAKAMVKQFGNFTFFLTVSINDLLYSIPAILAVRGETPTMEYLENLTWYQKHEILRSGPVTALRMFKRYTQSILTHLIKKEKILGECEAHFGRDEYQGRGSPHMHILLKMKDAPVLGEHPDSVVINYFDQHVSTYIPTMDEDPVMCKVGNVQRHKHSFYCSTDGKGTNCRFGVPWPESDRSRIEYDPENKKQPKIVHKREAKDKDVSTFPPVLLAATRSNCNIQYCTNIFATLNYTINYTLKQEKAVLDVLKNLKDSMPFNADVREQLRALSHAFFNNREISVQECVHRALGIFSMIYFSHDVIYIPSDPPETRHGIVKTKAQLQNLPPDSTDVFQNGVYERYANRPDELENICYASFASNYKVLYNSERVGKSTTIYTLKNDMGRMVKREHPIVIRTNSPSRKNDPVKYFFSKVCLFLPWRSDSDIYGPHQDAKMQFEDKIDIIKPNMLHFGSERAELIDEMIDQIREEAQERFKAFKKREADADPAHYMAYPPDNVSAPQDTDEDNRNNYKVEYREPAISREELQANIGALNDKQREFHDMVERHAEATAKGLNPKQLLTFLSGAGGVGKSFLLNCVRHTIASKFPDSNLYTRVVTSASTGVAAILIDGQTIHQAVQLDTQHSGFFDIKPLSHKKRHVLNEFYQHVKYLIIDEVSMLGDTNLIQIHSRLNDIYGIPKDSNVFFGNLNVIFVGDLHQIPPVMQSMVHKIRGISTLGTDLWKDLVSFHELTEVVRSKGDPLFTDMVHRVRVGKQTQSDIDTLRSRVVTTTVDLDEQMKAMSIFPTNKMCNEHNAKCINILAMSHEIHLIRSKDAFVDSKFQDGVRKVENYMSDNLNDTCGLPTTLQLCTDARVMVRVNVDVQAKIANGVCGTVKWIEYDVSPTMPTVHIMFDNSKVGEGKKHSCASACTTPCPLAGTVAIRAVEKEFISKKNKRRWVKRYMLPLQLAWASTVHKVQGMSLQSAYIWLEKASKFFSWQSGQAYTAISRLTSLAGLHFLAFNPQEIRTADNILEEYARLRALPKFDMGLSDTPNLGCDSDIVTADRDLPSASTIDICPVPMPVSSGPDLPSASNIGTCSAALSPGVDLPTGSNIGTCSAALSPRGDLPTASNIGTCSAALSPGCDLPTASNIGTCSADQHTAMDYMDHDSSPAPVQYVGRARIVDFLDSPKAHYFANLLRDHGFDVKTDFNTLQVGNSCGYNSAMVVCKLAHCDYTKNGDWMDCDILDCCFDPLSGRGLQSLLCHMGNGHLDIRETNPNSPNFANTSQGHFHSKVPGGDFTKIPREIQIYSKILPKRLYFQTHIVQKV